MALRLGFFGSTSVEWVAVVNGAFCGRAELALGAASAEGMLLTTVAEGATAVVITCAGTLEGTTTAVMSFGGEIVAGLGGVAIDDHTNVAATTLRTTAAGAMKIATGVFRAGGNASPVAIVSWLALSAVRTSGIVFASPSAAPRVGARGMLL
jgi:hypothetical protein